jgi:hypothetical protein
MGTIIGKYILCPKGIKKCVEYTNLLNRAPIYLKNTLGQSQPYVSSARVLFNSNGRPYAIYVYTTTTNNNNNNNNYYY